MSRIFHTNPRFILILMCVCYVAYFLRKRDLNIFQSTCINTKTSLLNKKNCIEHLLKESLSYFSPFI